MSTLETGNRIHRIAKRLARVYLAFVLIVACIILIPVAIVLWLIGE
jgi:hypothetical protein